MLNSFGYLVYDSAVHQKASKSPVAKAEVSSIYKNQNGKQDSYHFKYIGIIRLVDHQVVNEIPSND